MAFLPVFSQWSVQVLGYAEYAFSTYDMKDLSSGERLRIAAHFFAISILVPV